MIVKFSTSARSFQLQGIVKKADIFFKTLLKQPCFKLMKFQFLTNVLLKWKDMSYMYPEDNFTAENRKSLHVVFQSDDKLTYLC